MDLTSVLMILIDPVLFYHLLINMMFSPIDSSESYRGTYEEDTKGLEYTVSFGQGTEASRPSRKLKV